MRPCGDDLGPVHRLCACRCLVIDGGDAPVIDMNHRHREIFRLLLIVSSPYPLTNPAIGATFSGC